MAFNRFKEAKLRTKLTRSEKIALGIHSGEIVERTLGGLCFARNRSEGKKREGWDSVEWLW